MQEKNPSIKDGSERKYHYASYKMLLYSPSTVFTLGSVWKIYHGWNVLNDPCLYIHNKQILRSEVLVLNLAKNTHKTHPAIFTPASRQKQPNSSKKLWYKYKTESQTSCGILEVPKSLFWKEHECIPSREQINHWNSKCAQFFFRSVILGTPQADNVLAFARDGNGNPCS